MKTFHYIYTSIFLFPIVWGACSTAKQTYSDKNSNWNNKVVVFPSYANVQVIEHGNRLVTSKTSSVQSESDISSEEAKFIPVSVKAYYVKSGNGLLEDIANSGMLKTLQELNGGYNRRNPKAPRCLYKILDSLHENYGLFIYQLGFERTSENKVNQTFKDKAIGIGLLGTVAISPISSSSVMIGMLIDKQKAKIVKYKEVYFHTGNPTDKYIIRSQVRDIILSYFETQN